MQAVGIQPQALIINGDLTTSGNITQLAEFNNMWPTTKLGVPQYVGLGNHDYDKIAPGAFVMINYLVNTVTNVYGLPIDWTFVSSTYSTGSLAYSWNICVQSNCVHFVQLNNYPTYTASYTQGQVTYDITESLAWLTNDLNNAQHPVVINFHDYEDLGDSTDFVNALNASPVQILGVFVAHAHTIVGLKPTNNGQTAWCINGVSGQYSAPLLYSGSVPGNNYMLVRYRNGAMNAAYTLNVQSQLLTNVTSVPLTTQSSTVQC